MGARWCRYNATVNNISIIIPTLFPPESLSNEAAQIAHYGGVTEVIIVANTNSHDKDENHVHWRFLGKNKGFTGACNEGARIAKGNLLLFLNDDCNLSQDTLHKMIQYLDKNPRIVATQPIVYKPVTVNSINKQVENIGFWVDTRIGKAIPVTVNSNSKQKIYGLSGTCMLIKKNVFEEVGGFDESFHSYLEDVDLTIRLHKAGHRVEPCLEAEVTHTHMATSSRMGLYKEIHDVKNWWRLVVKHPDVFVHWSNLLPLLIERLRNVSGLVKKTYSLALSEGHLFKDTK